MEVLRLVIILILTVSSLGWGEGFQGLPWGITKEKVEELTGYNLSFVDNHTPRLTAAITEETHEFAGYNAYYCFYFTEPPGNLFAVSVGIRGVDAYSDLIWLYKRKYEEPDITGVDSSTWHTGNTLIVLQYITADDFTLIMYADPVVFGRELERDNDERSEDL